MVTRLRLVALVCLVGLWTSVARAEQFERTLAVERGTRLDLRLYGGRIAVRGWDKDVVRVRATHFSTDTIEVGQAGQVLTVRARARLAPPHAIDFEIDVPRWMPLNLAGTYLDITIEGVRADVRAETVRGDVRVLGGAGTVVLKSVEGEVVLEGARARAELSSANNGIRVTGLDGDLLAETISGSVQLRRVAGTRVEVSTVSGSIDWDGAAAPGGRYAFATHDGDIDVELEEQASVVLHICVFDGHLHSTFPVQWPDAAARRKGFDLRFGNGGARVEIESFRGTLSLRRSR